MKETSAIEGDLRLEDCTKIVRYTVVKQYFFKCFFRKKNLHFDYSLIVYLPLAGVRFFFNCLILNGSTILF